VPDVALVNNVLVAINHSVLLMSHNNAQVECCLSSLNLGIVVASSGGPTTWVIVGGTVGILVGVGLVSMVVGIVMLKRRWSKLKSALALAPK